MLPMTCIIVDGQCAHGHQCLNFED